MAVNVDTNWLKLGRWYEFDYRTYLREVRTYATDIDTETLNKSWHAIKAAGGRKPNICVLPENIEIDEPYNLINITTIDDKTNIIFVIAIPVIGSLFEVNFYNIDNFIVHTCYV